MGDDYPLFALLFLDRPADAEGPWFEPLLFSLATKLSAPLIHAAAKVEAVSRSVSTAIDFDVIVRLTSIFTMQKRAGLTVPPREAAFHTCGFIGTPPDRQSPGGHQYENFLAGVKRLAATRITLRDQSFPWLEAFDVLTAGDHEADLATTTRLPEFCGARSRRPSFQGPCGLCRHAGKAAERRQEGRGARLYAHLSAGPAWPALCASH